MRADQPPEPKLALSRRLHTFSRIGVPSRRPAGSILRRAYAAWESVGDRCLIHPPDPCRRPCVQPDAELLARFAADRDEAAFAALFDRHGPMVRAVCRRYCRDVHLAADAEQGVWLVLARRAAAVSRPERLANWLFGVAVRVGRKAAAAAQPRDVRVAPAAASSDVAVSVLADELLRVLDEELTALPDDERLPLVLCYLEGRTQDEAARVCGICLRTLRRWLDRGRVSLRRRLERRGVAPAAAIGALAVAPAAAPASARALAAALPSGPVPSSLSPWIAEELAMTGTRAWWLRVAMVVGLGLGGLTAAVWSAADKPVPADSTRRPRRNRQHCQPAQSSASGRPASATRVRCTGWRSRRTVRACMRSATGRTAGGPCRTAGRSSTSTTARRRSIAT